MSLSSCCTNLRPDRPLRQRGAPWPAVSLAAGWSISRAQHISPGSSERHSRSDSPFSAYDYDEHRRDLRAIVTKLDLNDVTLVGWSTGGAIALKYVRDVGERVARLVLVGAVGPRFSQEPHQPFGMPADVMSALLEAERSNSPDARMGLH